MIDPEDYPVRPEAQREHIAGAAVFNFRCASSKAWERGWIGSQQPACALQDRVPWAVGQHQAGRQALSGQF